MVVLGGVAFSSERGTPVEGDVTREKMVATSGSIRNKRSLCL